MKTSERDIILAAYATLQNGDINLAKEILIVGLEGGNINNPLDFGRCYASWKSKYARGKK